MSATRTSFREALQTALQTALDIEFQAGPIEGPQTDRDIGCVWWERKRPFGRDFNLEEDSYVVRVFRRFKQDQGGSEPRAMVSEALEQLAEDLETAFKANLTALGHWYFNVVEVAPNHQQQAVEARLVAYDANPSSAGG